jgi:hypothetical protein
MTDFIGGGVGVEGKLAGAGGQAILSAMAEFPDANTGGLDPGETGLTGVSKPAVPMWRRVRAWAIIVLAYPVVLGAAAAAVPMLRSAMRPGLASDDRLEHLLWGAMLLLPLGYIVRYFLRTKLKTGRWTRTKEQRQKDLERVRANCAPSGAARGCGVKQHTWTKLLRAWATCTAMDKTRSTPQRAAAWAVLAAYVAAMLGLTAIGVICIGAGLPDDKSSATPLMIGVGLLVLLVPAMAVRGLVKGIRAGTLGTTREELEQMQAQQAAWRLRESQKPLRSKLVNLAIALVIYGWYWWRITVHHAQHPHESWITPVVMTSFLLYTVYVQFRKPKSAAGEADGSTVDR